MQIYELINRYISSLDNSWYIEDAGNDWYYLKCDRLGAIKFGIRYVLGVDNGKFAQKMIHEEATVEYAAKEYPSLNIVENVCKKLNRLLAGEC